ncbi:LOW QUALITY PROTEIN: tenascin-N-like [Acridotheres tristis]
MQVLNSMENSVSWDPVTDGDNYLLTYYPAGYEMLVKQIHVPKEQLEMVRLHPGTTYNVTLPSCVKGIASEPKYLEASTVWSAVNAIWVTEEMEYSLEMEWENLPKDMHYYKLKFRYLVEVDEKQVMIPKSNDPRSRYILSGLKPGTEHEVIPVKDNTEGNHSQCLARQMTLMDSPKSLVTDQVTEDSATISWDRVQAPIDRYVVSYTSAGGHTKKTEVGKDRSITALPRLKPGMKFTIHLWADLGSKQSKKASSGTLTVQLQLRGRIAYIIISIFLQSILPLHVSGVTHSGVVTWTSPAAQIDGCSLTYQGEDGTSKLPGSGEGQQLLPADAGGPVELLELPLPVYHGVQQNINASSSMYIIYLNGHGSRLLQVYCDRSTNGGLDKLHDLTSSSSICYELRIDLWTAGKSVCAVYDFFQVASSRERYRLSVGNCRGNAGEEGRVLVLSLHRKANSGTCVFVLPVEWDQLWFSLKRKVFVGRLRRVCPWACVVLKTGERVTCSWGKEGVCDPGKCLKKQAGKFPQGGVRTDHSVWKFTTWDRDNDVALSSCVVMHHGAWWNCHLANLNGKHGESNHSEAVSWESWKGHEFSISSTEMKIYPQSSSKEPVLGRRKSLSEKRKKIRTLCNTIPKHNDSVFLNLSLIHTAFSNTNN